jgi:alpha-tubulin suppressor-like RCC1 family protein
MGDALPSVDLGLHRTASAIATGLTHVCAILDDHSLKCWGDNSYGQLGQGDTATRGDGTLPMGDGLPPIALGTKRTARAVAAGHVHTCSVLDDGSVKCFGGNVGQLGLGDATDRGRAPNQMGDNLPAVNLGSSLSATTISALFRHVCVTLDDSHGKCWGLNADGQLGLETLNDHGGGPGQMGDALPEISLGRGETPSSTSVGALHTCALLGSAHVKCWGNNDFGQLGLGDTVERGGAPNEMGDLLTYVGL